MLLSFYLEGLKKPISLIDVECIELENDIKIVGGGPVIITIPLDQFSDLLIDVGEAQRKLLRTRTGEIDD